MIQVNIVAWSLRHSFSIQSSAVTPHYLCNDIILSWVRLINPAKLPGVLECTDSRGIRARTAKVYPTYDTKTSDWTLGNVEQNNKKGFSLLLLPGPQWSGVAVTFRVPSIRQTKLFHYFPFLKPFKRVLTNDFC